MKKFLSFLLFTFLITTQFNLYAQLSGPKSIPGDYATIAAAITDLNANGVGAGGVTFNIAAGHTETASNLVIAITTNFPTLANQVIFQKSGVGANPLITAAPGVSPTIDGIIKLSGADYITFDGIDLLDPATNVGDAMMEWGFAILRASSTDGSQNNTIKNCNITLQKINTISTGIYHANQNLAGTTTNSTEPAGENSYNTYFGNSISNVYRGIRVVSASTARDNGNQIGVFGGPTNTITNFGGSTVICDAIRVEGQLDFKVTNNTINGGTGTTNTIYGIIATLLGSPAPSYEISHNTISISGNSTTNLSMGIRALGTGDTVWLHSNVVENCNMVNTSAAFSGIVHDPTGTTNVAYVYNNIVRNNTHFSTGVTTLLNATTITELYVYDNEIFNNQKTGISGTMNCLTIGTSGVECYDNEIYNNSMPNTSGATASAIYGYINSGSPPTELVYNNVISNLSISGTSTSASSTVTGIRSNTAAVTVKEIYGNVIENLSGVSGNTTTGGVNGIWSSLGTSTKIYKNKVHNLTNNGTNGTTVGCWVTTGTAIEVYNNFFSDMKAPLSGNANAVIGINSSAPSTNSTLSLYYNSIYLNASGGTTFGSSGISVTGNTTGTTGNLTMNNNLIINLSTPGATSGLTAAYRRTNVNLANYNDASDYNNFYVGTTAANRVLYSDGTNTAETLIAMQTLVSPKEANSISKQVFYEDVAVGDLHLTGASIGDLDLAGIPITGITTDIDDEVRDAIFPYMGADEGDIPLPVDIIFFNASVSGRDVNLSWATSWEVNNERFEVQRKIAESESPWITVGSVQGSGTSYQQNQYSFTDKALMTGHYEYRLVQFDYDGNSTADFSLNQIVEIGVPINFALEQNFPNPFNPSTKINFQIPVEGLVKLSVFDITGREVATLVNEVLNPGYYTYDFNGSSLASGAYFYRLVTQQSVITKRMALVK